MKKIKLLALILIIAMLAVVFTACDEIFKKNEERDFNQVVATVSYSTTVNGKNSTQTANVLKGDLESSYANYGYIYVNYYGMSESAAAETLLKQLYQRKALVMFAKAYLIDNACEGIAISALPESVSIEKLLTDAEINKAIKATNEDMKKSLDSVIEGLIADKKANSGTSQSSEEAPTPVSDKVFKVYFNSNGGSEVETQKVKDGTYATEPTAPTRDGYTFGGWYTEDTYAVKYDFKTAVSANTTLYAKWYEYTAPRTVREVSEEDEEFDPQVGVTIEREKFFFDADYIATLTFKDMESGYTEQEYLDFLDEGIKQLKNTIAKNYRSYEYFLSEQYETVLLEKFKRCLNASQTVSEEEINAKYEALISQNKESFTQSSDNYSSNLKSALSDTIYNLNTTAGQRYGFVTNILLKFDDDELKQLTDLITSGTSTAEQVKAFRDKLVAEHTVKISNHDYDADYECDKHECDGNCDPMTCPEHECNATETLTEENYNKLIEIVAVDGTPQIKYNAVTCPSMAYLLTEWPAFTTGTKIGVVDQYKASLEQVDAVCDSLGYNLVQKIYWRNEVVTAWLYLIGDDSGAVSSDSNNGGLGYLVCPEEVGASGYIDEFETRARDLIAKGTGSAYIGSGSSLSDYYVVGDNFIDEKTTESAYCGIFLIYAGYVPYDVDAYKSMGGTSLNGTGDDFETVGNLPLDYVIKYDGTSNGVTIKANIEKALLEAKKTANYDSVVNTFLNGDDAKVEKFDKIIKQVYSK